MKKFKIIHLLLLAISITFLSCKKDVEDRLPGDWEMTWKFTEKENSSGSYETETEILLGSAKFEEDGTGILEIDGEAMEMTWSATEDKVTVTIDGEAIVFDVIENEKKVQKWEYTESGTETSYTYDENFNMIPYTYNYEYKLEVKLDKE